MRKAMDTRVAVEGQLKISGTVTLPPEGLRVAAGTGPGMPDASVTVPLPPRTVIEVMPVICALYAGPDPMSVSVTLTLRVPGSVPSVRVPIATESWGATDEKLAPTVVGAFTVKLVGLAVPVAPPL